jgi:hypothetical protein
MSKSPPNRTPIAPKAASSRSAVGNGKRLIAGVDKTSAEYRQYRDIVSDLIEHLGSDATAVQRALCEETAGLIVWCRRARLRLLQDDPCFDLAQYVTGANALLRLLKEIGQDRRLKDVTDTVESVMREYAAKDTQ